MHNPRSNLNNAVGYGRPARFADPVALGTDGIGADMLEEFRLAFALARADDVDHLARHGVGLARDRRAISCPRRAPTGSRGRTRRWSRGTSPTPPACARVRVEVGGEVVLDEHGPTRVDAGEIRAMAAEQAAAPVPPRLVSSTWP